METNESLDAVLSTPELINHILSFCDVPDIARFARVSKYWHIQCNNERLDIELILTETVEVWKICVSFNIVHSFISLWRKLIKSRLNLSKE
jgi:hypothetical protein